MLNIVGLILGILLSGCSGTKVTTSQSDWFQGQERVKSRLTIKKSVISSKEKIEFDVEMQNTSAAPLSYDIRWDPGCLHIADCDGKEMRYVGPAYSHGSRRVVLSPNGTYRLSLEEWPENYTLLPGEYQAWFFEEELAKDKSTITIQTPRVRFRLVCQ